MTKARDLSVAPNAWTSYTPVLKQGTTTVSATVDYAKYMQVGKTVHLQVRVTATGTGSAGTEIFISPPSGLTPVNTHPSTIGTFMLLDAGTAYFVGVCSYFGTNIAGTSYNSQDFMGKNSPNMTIASNDQVSINVTYEVA